MSGDKLFIDGGLLEESWAGVRHANDEASKTKTDVRSMGNFGPMKLSAREYFVLGDERDRSYDSRHWGALPDTHIKGKALFVYWASDLTRLGQQLR